MLKQLFKNAFIPKEMKFGFNLQFISGLKNHNEIKGFQKGDCALNFENQKMYIRQGDNEIVENVSNISSVRSWAFKRRYLIIEINTKNHNEYKFSIEMSGNVANIILINPFIRYFDSHGIPFEYCAESDSEDE